jgi:uncharacterized ferritin-like protein (DUF455 family)
MVYGRFKAAIELTTRCSLPPGLLPVTVARAEAFFLQAVEAIAKILHNLARVLFNSLDEITVDFVNHFLRTMPHALNRILSPLKWVFPTRKARSKTPQ